MCAFVGMTLTHADYIQFEDIVFWILCLFESSLLLLLLSYVSTSA